MFTQGEHGSLLLYGGGRRPLHFDYHMGRPVKKKDAGGAR